MVTANPGPLDSSTSVAVLGAGTMGGGIAWVAAEAGHNVHLYDIDADAIDAAIAEIDQRLQRSVSKGKRSNAQREAILGRINPATSLVALSDAGLVIEAIAERVTLKQDVLAELEQLLGDDAILATNTSSLSVTTIATALQRPERLVGMHFFNPAPVMPLVEVVRGDNSAAAVVDVVFATALAWGKTPVRCTSTPGFIVNRVARPFYSESIRLLTEGISDPQTIDTVLISAGGFRMGPFALMDLVGLDINLAVSTSVYEQTSRDPRFAPSEQQQSLVGAGHLGRKTDQGWYTYPPGPAAVDPMAAVPHPTTIEISDDPYFDGLARRLEERHIACRRAAIAGVVVDGIPAARTTGLTARAASAVVFDLVLDWENATGIAVATTPGDEAIASMFQAAGLNVYLVGDIPGLIVMRLVAMLIGVASDAALAKVATTEDIDTAMRLGTNYPGGPFEWVEILGGVEPILSVIENLHLHYGEDRYRTPAAITSAAESAYSLRQSYH